MTTQTKSRDLIREAKERAGPDGSPAHELRMLGSRSRDAAERIRIGVVVEDYAIELEREIRRLRRDHESLIAACSHHHEQTPDLSDEWCARCGLNIRNPVHVSSPEG